MKSVTLSRGSFAATTETAPISVGPGLLVVLSALTVVGVDNLSLFRLLAGAFPLRDNLIFVGSVGVLQTALLSFFLLPFASRRLLKPALVIVLLLSAAVGYFQDSFGTVIDSVMIQNIVETDARESADLITGGYILRLFLYGLLPALLVIAVPLSYPTLGRSVVNRLLGMGACLVVIALAVAPLTAHYTSLIREHKEIRYYANPLGAVVGATQYFWRDTGAPVSVAPMGTDSVVTAPGAKPRLVVMVVGEAVRAGNLALNGYDRDTTPRLAAMDVTSFADVDGCGTATAISVPCMFSLLSRDDFSVAAGLRQENSLDVLSHAGVKVLWRDNNSDSKGVALRVPYEDFSQPDTNPLCDTECRDVGMLQDIDAWARDLGQEGGLIVLHQMGNHGPAYYKRYPSSFDRFSPVCQSSELATCTNEEIVNAYDNAITYTDYFLAEVINRLRRLSNDFETAMIYVGDHGESLGEYGLYLHGLPYSIAPEEQIKVPVVMWFSESFPVDRSALDRQSKIRHSHDAISQTLIELFGVETSLRQDDQPLLQIHRAWSSKKSVGPSLL